MDMLGRRSGRADYFWSCVMRRSTFDQQESSWNLPAEALDAGGQNDAYERDRWPTAGELLFETGIVLAVALGTGVVIQLVIGVG
jgi:hypothetical protein